MAEKRRLKTLVKKAQAYDKRLTRSTSRTWQEIQQVVIEAVRAEYQATTAIDQTELRRIVESNDIASFQVLCRDEMIAVLLVVSQFDASSQSRDLLMRRTAQLEIRHWSRFSYVKHFVLLALIFTFIQFLQFVSGIAIFFGQLNVVEAPVVLLHFQIRSSTICVSEGDGFGIWFCITNAVIVLNQRIEEVSLTVESVASLAVALGLLNVLLVIHIFYFISLISRGVAAWRGLY